MFAREQDSSRPTRIALVGIHGYGVIHLRHLAAMGRAVQLVAVADPQPPVVGSLPDGTLVFPDQAELLARVTDLDVVIIATPISTHFQLATEALKAGVDVYLEKPPVTSLADLDELLAIEAASPGVLQVGFQGLGLHGSPEFAGAVASLSDVLSIGAVGLWQRSPAYWNRSRWAGMRTLDGVDIVDGAITNPFAHAVVSALRLAGVAQRDDVGTVELDLYRANPIEVDDTSVLRVRAAAGSLGPVSITCAFTVCAERTAEPYVLVVGVAGTLRFFYTEDRIELTDADGAVSHVALPRRDLLENLIAHRLVGEALVSPLSASAPFMRVLDAIRTSPLPRVIGSALTEVRSDGTIVVSDVTAWAERAALEGRTFEELGAPWVQPDRPRVVRPDVEAMFISS
ncbi:Gfo/Idh/MocA family protein [Plantibacter sp. YIM 135347]|uniref:Gfo/Idh/MocA family protein n=1 Tax=Plantibacter sp. YIM 135347 TaxID=3423919 RepID=UPI003D35416E